MSEPPHVASAEALFRHHVVSLVLTARLGGTTRADAVRLVARERHPQVDGRPRQVGERTIRRWLRAFEHEGFSGLEPAARSRTQSSVVLPSELLEFVRAQKELDPRASLPELVDRARESGVLRPHDPVDRGTLWRACRRMGVPVLRRRRGRDRDTRRFEHPHRMQVVLCDGKHFRAGAARLRRVALFFLDDATRRALHAVVGTSESTALFLRGLYETVRQHGLMDVVYDDHGSGFTALDARAAVARLGALLVHGERAYPEGHGKVERFNQFVLARLLRQLDGRTDVDPDCGALELRLQHFLRERYDHRPHESLDGDAPLQRWQADSRPLRLVDSDEQLRRCFVVQEKRRVSNDHVVSFDGVAYEVPRGHAGRLLPIQRHLLDGTLWMMHEDRPVQLHSVDLAANARDHRASSRAGEQDERSAPLPHSAAELHWRRDFSPLVGPDGGFRSDQHEADDDARDEDIP